MEIIIGILAVSTLTFLSLFVRTAVRKKEIEKQWKEKGIEIKAEIENLAFDYMDSVDFSALLNNLLDNAIGGAQASQEKKLKLQIISQKGMDVITVKNSIGESVLAHNPEFVSTKKEPGHGYGMKQIRCIVEKYEGMMDIYEKKNMFIVSLMFTEEL